MIEGKMKVFLNPESILSKISAYDIFRYYMPNKDWKLNHVCLSPFRKESNPSFLISNRGGNLSFIDFGNNECKGDCFTFVKMMYNTSSLYETLKKIDFDFGLGISTSEVKDYKKMVSEYVQPTEVKQYSFVQVKTRKFTNRELEYWNSYHQSFDDLRSNDVYAIDKVYLNRQRFPVTDNEMMFGYLYDNGHWKIYRPFGDKKKKWVPNNVPATSLDGKLDILSCDVAFITKSKKDYMVMKKIIPSCCAVQNENVGCFSSETVEYIKSNSKRQVLGFDSDSSGVTSSKQITKLFDFEYCNVPRQYLTEGIKDFADWAKTYGLKKIEEYLKEKQIL